MSPRPKTGNYKTLPVNLDPVVRLAYAVILQAVLDAGRVGESRPRWMSKQEYGALCASRQEAVEFLAGGPDLAFWLDLVGLPPDWAPLVRLREELGD